ncbi:hypothetical protein [Kaistella palustris]|uniref:hypothetical protein n=1 Tax=Kaistella palustris TaxID=493376 RepID=UPI0004118FF5|nr:hypothetical protein [Kaistella palustris]
MLRKNKNKTLISFLFTGIYIFVALFSQFFHNHGSSEVFKEYHFQKTEKSVSPSKLAAEAGGCLSCHIFHEGKFLVPPEQPSFCRTPDFTAIPYFSEDQLLVSRRVYTVFLRGPPSIFI